MRFLFPFLWLVSGCVIADYPNSAPLEKKSQMVKTELGVRDDQGQVNSRETSEYARKTLDIGRSDEYELYEQGRHYLSQQRLDLARKVFDEVVDKYEGTPEAILARFWIGEFMLHAQNYPAASIALGQAYGALKKARHQKDFSLDAFHGEEDRFPEILAKLAYALKMVNKRQDACITLRQLKKEYQAYPETLGWYINNLSKDLRCR